jgi:hypothetical protein
MLLRLPTIALPSFNSHVIAAMRSFDRSESGFSDTVQEFLLFLLELTSHCLQVNRSIIRPRELENIFNGPCGHGPRFLASLYFPFLKPSVQALRQHPENVLVDPLLLVADRVFQVLSVQA